MLVLFALYAAAGWLVCGLGVAGFYEYIEHWEGRFERGPRDVEGFFPTLGVHLHRSAYDLGLGWARLRGSYIREEAERFMDGLVIAQVVVMPVVIAFILVCVTAMVMRRYKGVR